MPNLTPRSYAIVAVICLMGIAQQWTVDAFPWWQVTLAAYLAAMTYEWVRLRETGIGVSMTSNPRLRLGRQSTITLTLTNPSPTPQKVIFAAELPGALEVASAERRATVPSFAELSVPIDVLPVDVGHHVWQRLPMRVLGPVGLGNWPRNIRMITDIQIVPDLLGAGNRPAGLAEAGSASRQRAGSGQELHHLRPYRPGDPRHTIDWKATARSGALTTRVFGEDQHLDIVLILDLGRTSRTRIDGLSQLGHYINLSARFAEHAVANEDQIGLIAVTDRPVAVVPPGRGQRVVGQVRDALGRMQTEAVETDLLAAARELARFVRHRAMIVVLTDLYGATSGGRLTQCVRMWVPQHLPMVVGMLGSEVNRLARQYSREWLDPYRSLAASTYTEDLHRGTRGLRQLGAETVLSRPRDLEKRVFSHYHRLKSQRRI
jgi:uncharacterized protein (DUF58 family)